MFLDRKVILFQHILERQSGGKIMDARERAERIVIEQVRKAIKVGFLTLPITAILMLKSRKNGYQRDCLTVAL